MNEKDDDITHLGIVSEPEKSLIVPAEFPSLTLGTAKTVVQKISATHSAEKVKKKANRPDLPDLPVKDPVKIASVSFLFLNLVDEMGFEPYLAFLRGLLEVVDYVQGDDVLNIMCDYDEETALTCHCHYLGVRRARADVRAKVAAISFADDKHFLPLQASDFMAYLARHQARAQFYNIKNVWLSLFIYMIQDEGQGKFCGSKCSLMSRKRRTL